MIMNFPIMPGMVIKTNYSERVYKVLMVHGGCTCPRYSDQLGYTSTGMEISSPLHFDIICYDWPKIDNAKSYLNGYTLVEGQVKSIWNTNDQIEILQSPKGLQLSLL